MLRRFITFLVLLFTGTLSAQSAELAKPLITGLKNPESVVVSKGKIYVSVIGEFNKDGDGSIVEIKNNKAVPFATGLNDPKGLVAFKNNLYVADKDCIWRIDNKGKKTEFVPASAFPSKPQFLNDLEVDTIGKLYVTDSGDLKGAGGAVYEISLKGKVRLIVDAKKAPVLQTPNGLALDGGTKRTGAAWLLLLDFGSGQLHRLNVKTGKLTKVEEGFGGGDGVIFDKFGRLYLSDYKNGKVFVIPRPGQKPILITDKFTTAADICLDHANERILVPDMKAGTLTAIPTQVPGQEINTKPLALKSEVAFPKLKWTGWKVNPRTGIRVPLRPIVLTHADDGTDRVFVATQRGVIHVFPNDQKATETKVYLDVQDRVTYSDKMNEEGLLGFAFHPKYKENGEFYLYYSTKKKPHTSVISRFKVSKKDPNKADPDSEEIIMTLPQPYWNHNGGTIAFGKDGYLYIALGDGGSANDPKKNGQNLNTLLGSVLRIDVDQKTAARPYGIPKDNPFIGRKDARPEIWAYGVRNLWRISFDRKTGDCWAGEVGQDLYEEINILTKGGNYGWNWRESFHPFGEDGVGANDKMIDPIWEYHHDVGLSITGGNVYRGKRLPELEGAYVYADYVTAKIWALWYDKEKKRVVANRPIGDRRLPILSFGEDEKGDVYYLVVAGNGQGIYRFVKTK